MHLSPRPRCLEITSFVARDGDGAARASGPKNEGWDRAQQSVAHLTFRRLSFFEPTDEASPFGRPSKQQGACDQPLVRSTQRLDIGRKEFRDSLKVGGFAMSCSSSPFLLVLLSLKDRVESWPSQSLFNKPMKQTTPVCKLLIGARGRKQADELAK